MIGYDTILSVQDRLNRSWNLITPDFDDALSLSYACL